MPRRPTRFFSWTAPRLSLAPGPGPRLKQAAAALVLVHSAAAQLAPLPLGATPSPTPSATPLPGLRSETLPPVNPAPPALPPRYSSAVGSPVGDDAAPDDGAPNDTAASDVEAAPPEDAMEPIPQDDADLGNEAFAEIEESSRDELAGLGNLIPRFFHFNVALGAAYDDNIFQSSTDPVGTSILQAQFSTALPLLTLGKNKLVASYTAVGSLYSEYPDLSGVEQAFSLGADGGESFQFTLGKNTITLSANYSRPTGGPQGALGQLNSGSFNGSGFNPSQNPNNDPSQREVGQYAGRTLVSGGINLSRPIADQASANLGVTYSTILYDDSDYQSSQDLAAQLGLQYQITGKTALGLAGGYGTTFNDQNADQIHQNISLTANYQATGKLVISSAAGVDFRQYGAMEALTPNPTPPPAPAPTLPVDPSADPLAAAEPVPTPAANPVDTAPAPSLQQEDSTNFVFSLQANYQIRVRTSLFLGANRGLTGSAIRGSSAVLRNSFNFGLNQKIGSRLSLALLGGYDFSESTLLQSTSSAALTADEPSKYWFGRANLSYLFRNNINVGLFYEHRNNEGGSTSLTFVGNRFGISAGFSF